MRYELYGIGGYCADCSPEHDHPLNNLIEVIEVEEEVTVDESDSE